jgi:hypothetical protein
VVQKTVSVRIRPELYAEATLVAKARGLSFNDFVQQGLEELLKAEQREKLRQGFEILALDADADVEFGWAAQSEVAFE